MYLLKIIPIAKGLPNETYTYFYKDKISIGDLVEIKIKNRILFGIIISCENLLQNKMSVKNSDFIIKKIERISLQNFINIETIKSLENLSYLLLNNISNLIDTFTLNNSLKYLIENFKKENNNLNKLNSNIFNNSKNKSENKNHKAKIIINEYEKRLKIYKNIIKKSIIKNESLIIYFPTINELYSAKKELEKNIEKYCISLHANLSNKNLKLEIEKIKTENIPLIIFSTPSILPFIIKERINLKNIILEKENSFYYFTHSSKRQIDFREIVKFLSKENNLNLILGAEIPSLNTYLEFKNKEINEYNKSNNINENNKNENVLIIDMKNKNVSLKENKYNKIYFSQEAIKKMEEIRKNNIGKIFIFTKRKGLYTETICADCNEILKCESCNKPYILYNNKENKNRIYICPLCKKKIELKNNEELNCKNCNSWNLIPLGIGTEGIEKNLNEIGFKTFILDQENVKTKRQALKIIENFKKEKLAILIGTELAINFLEKDINLDFILSVSFDSLFSLPEINIDEKILNLYIDLKEKFNISKIEKNIIKNNFYIQTRIIENPIWKIIKEENYFKFLNNEIVNRKEMNLPPFVNILKITLNKKEAHLKEYIEKIIFTNYKKFKKDEKNYKKEISNIVWHYEKNTNNNIGIIFISKNCWQEKTKSGKIIPNEFIKNLAYNLSNFKIEINPPNLYS